ncbi:MAG: TolC family protein, partial [Planctomycetota bacterium]
AFFEAGRIDFFQVEFARQALFSAQSRLLGTERGLQQALDNFKVTLGLPPDIDVELEDDIIAPFQLVDPEIIPLQNSLTLLQQKAGQTMSRLFATAVEPALEKDKNRPANGDANTDEESPDEDEAPEESGNDDLADDLGQDIQFDSGNDADAADQSADELPDADILNSDDADQSQESRSFLDDVKEPEPPTLEWSASVEKELGNLLNQLEQSLRLLKKARDSHLDGASEDIEQLKSALKPRGRIAKLLKKQIRERLERSRGKDGDEVTEDDIAALLPYDPEELEALPDALSRTMTQVREELDASEERITKLTEELEELLETGDELAPEKLYEEIQTKLRTTVPDELNEFSATVLSITLVQARARTESATLPTIELKWYEAVEQARTNRLDWMNARAQLVDTWRTIQFTARDLESQLDISLSGGIGNVGDNPLDIRWDSGQIRFGIEFDAPITRLAERNVYRQSLIDYQRARRNFYRFEDGVAVSLRDIIRRLEINQINFELQRAAVEVAISQVELSRLRLQEPPRPNETGGLGVNTARDLVSALQGLLGAQNDFLNVWINQEALRRFLDLDMGTMQLDGSGMWIDPGPSLGQNANEAFDVMASPAGSAGMMEAPLEFEAPFDPTQQPSEFQLPPVVEAMEFAPEAQPQFE